MDWEFVVTDLFGVTLGEIITPLEPEIVIPMKKPPTATIKIRSDEPVADEILNRQGDVLLKVYQDVGTHLTSDVTSSATSWPVSTTAGWAIRGPLGYILVDGELCAYDPASLTATSFPAVVRAVEGTAVAHKSGTRLLPIRFHGPCSGVRETQGDDGVYLSVSFIGPFGVFAQRMVGITPDGSDRTFTGVDRAQILVTMLNEANLESVPPDTFGSAVRSYTGVSEGTVATMRTGDWTNHYKPLSEAFTDIAATMAPAQFEALAGPYDVEDNFTATVTAFLNTRAADGTPSQTWDDSGHGATGGFIVDAAGDNLVRSTTGDSSGGRHAFIGPTRTTMFAQVFIDRSGTMGAPATSQTVSIRGTDENNRLSLYVWEDVFPGHQQFVVEKLVGGVREVLWTSPFGDIIQTGMGGGYLRLAADASGNWAAWWWPAADPSYQSTPIQQGYHADLEAGSGKSVASGKAGIGDGNGTATACDRVYDSFHSDVPALSLVGEELEFEIEPMESLISSAWKFPQIGQLNIGPRLGVDRPSAVFELEADTMRNYTREFTRLPGLLTRAFSLPSEAPPWTFGAVVSSDALDEWGTRGLYEEVLPTDFADGSLRKAFLDLAVGIRKAPRQVIEFEPGPAAPQYGIDYLVGDTVSGRAKFQNVVRFEADVSTGTGFRVYGVTIKIGALGKMVAAPRLVPDE